MYIDIMGKDVSSACLKLMGRHAAAQQAHDVVMTCTDVSTSVRRHSDVMCQLGELVHILVSLFIWLWL